MKTVLTIIALVLSSAVFAHNDGNTNDKEKSSVQQTVEQIVTNREVVNELGVEGKAEITLTIDEAGQVHLDGIQTDNYVLEYHIRKSIEGAVMIVEDSLVGKTIHFIVDVVQSK